MSELGNLETVQCSDEVQISNSFDASQLFFNPPIMEAKAFLKRLQEKDWGWYYFGCKDCKKRVYNIGTNIQMVNGNEITTHLWWFKIHVVVKDGTGEASLLILDWTAEESIHVTAEDFLNCSLDELQDIESFPEAITILVGKTFMFGIAIEKDNVTSKGGINRVGKVWQDLNMLMTGGSTNSWTQSDVGTTNLSGSEDSFLMLETEATEDTVITPSSKRKATSTECAPDITSTSKKQCTKVFVKKEKPTKDDGSSSKKSG
ncbi:hypothetical protein N665_0146s0006 [Sinapis alba]|nr:hypothetical protein N665_0146s0006 [Sinapis alba]